MARSATAQGTHGTISLTGEVQRDGRWGAVTTGEKPQRYRAACRYRGADDDLTRIVRHGATKGAARAALNAAVAEHDAVTEHKRTARSRVTLASAGAAWLADVDRDSTKADSSKAHYHHIWSRHIQSASIAKMTLTEVNTVPELRRFLQQVADTSGSGAAKSTRSVLSGVLGMAVDDGRIPVNAMRSIRPVTARTHRDTVKDSRRALTEAELDHLLDVAEKHDDAVRIDAVDVLAVMTYTGARISEALAVRWDDVDLDAETVHVRGTKSAGADRVLAMPPELVERLRQRAETKPTGGVVLTSPDHRDLDKPRDRHNVARVLRKVLDDAGLEWASPHSLRRTAATMILEAGLPITVAAAQLGHSDAALTLRYYAAKRDEPSKAAASALSRTRRG